MISCTEFIPLYSEFFTFLEARGGHDAVVRYWEYLGEKSIGDKSNPKSLLAYLERDGIDGAWNYWSMSLTEEACDVYRVYDPVKKTGYTHLRHCPSRGMLNDLKHIEPYWDYCSHCDVIYNKALGEYGITRVRDTSKIANAECAIVMYRACDPMPGDEVKEVSDPAYLMDIKAEDNKYLHKDFHLSGDHVLRYTGANYGENCVRDFLATYAKRYYSPQIEDAKKRGLIALKEWIERVYEVEEASEVLHTEMNEKSLTVTVDKSPVIEFMRSLNQEPSKYYIEQTRTLYAAIADACNYGFSLEYYNEDGGTQFRFFERKF